MTTDNYRLVWSQSGHFLSHDVSARCEASVKRRVPLLEHTLLTFPEQINPGFSRACVAQSAVFCVMSFISLFVWFFLSLFFWPLYCLSFDSRLLITPLVLSSFS